VSNLSCLGIIYPYANASLLKAKNTVKDAKKPVFKPIVWQVDAYDKQSWDKSVNAQPDIVLVKEILQQEGINYRPQRYLRMLQK